MFSGTHFKCVLNVHMWRDLIFTKKKFAGLKELSNSERVRSTTALFLIFLLTFINGVNVFLMS